MPNHSGAMIALRVPEPEMYAINPPTEETTPVDELHITLGYLGEAAEISDEQRAAVLEAVQVLADTADAPKGLFPATQGVFPPDPESQDATPMAPYYAAPSNTENFNSLREDLLVHLAARGVADLVSTKHPVFHPHVTLAYAPLDTPPDLSHLPTPMPTTFGDIIVRFGDEEHEFSLNRQAEGPELPLTASVRATLSTLSEQKRISEDYLTSLYLRQRQVRSTPAQTRAQAALEAVTASVDPSYRTKGYQRIEELTHRARLEADPVSRTFAAARALALAGRTPAPVSPNEARELAALTASLRALIADGNSSVARSLRARAQLRDRYGRWIEQGGGVRFKVREPGSPGGGYWVHGTVEGFDIPNGRVNVKLEDGRVVAIPNKKLEQPKAILGLDIGKAIDAAKKFVPKSAGKKNKATLPEDHDPVQDAANKAQDDSAVEAMDRMQKDLAETYPDATVSGGNIAPLVNDPRLKDEEPAARDAGDGKVSFQPTKTPKGTANKDAEVTFDLADVDTVRASIDRMTAEYQPTQIELDAMTEAERNKAVATARSKAYGRMATLYNERGADQELLRAPAVGTEDELEEVAPDAVNNTEGAPSAEELTDAANDAFNELQASIKRNGKWDKVRDRIGSTLSKANQRFLDGTDDQDTYLNNLDRIKEYANSQEPSFVGPGASVDSDQEAFSAFAESIDDVHAAGGGTDDVAKARQAVLDARSLIDEATQWEGDAGPQGWTPELEDLDIQAGAIEKAIGDGTYLEDPASLVSDLRALSDALVGADDYGIHEGDDGALKEVTAELDSAVKTLEGAAPEAAKAEVPEAPAEGEPVDKRPLKYRTKQIPQMSKRDLAREIAQRVLGDTPLDESNPEHKKIVDSWNRSGRDFLEERVAHDRDVDSKVKTDDPIERQLVDAETTATDNPKGANNVYPSVNVHTEMNPDGSYSYTVTPTSGEPVTGLDRQGALDEINKHVKGTSPLEEPTAPVVSETIDESTAPETVDEPEEYFGDEDPVQEGLTNLMGEVAELFSNPDGSYKTIADAEADASMSTFMDTITELSDPDLNTDLDEAADILESHSAVIVDGLSDDPAFDNDALESFANSVEAFASTLRDSELNPDLDTAESADSPVDEAPAADLPEFQDIYDTLSELDGIDGDEFLEEPFAAVANTVINTGKSLTQGKITNEQAAEFLGNAMGEITALKDDLENVDKFDGTTLGDDVAEIESMIQSLHQKLNTASVEEPVDEVVPEPTPEPEPEPEAPTNASPELTEARNVLNNWFDALEEDLLQEPDFESGQGADWKEPVKAKEDFASFIGTANAAISDYESGAIDAPTLETRLERATDAWHTSEGFDEATAGDQDGELSDKFYAGDKIEEFFQLVPELSGGTPTPPSGPLDPWNTPEDEVEVPEIPEIPTPVTDWISDLMGEEPPAEVIPDTATQVKELFDGLHDSLTKLAAEDADGDDYKDVVNAANLYIDALNNPDEEIDEALVEGEKDRAQKVADAVEAELPEDSSSEVLDPGTFQGLIDQISDYDSPVAKFMASHLQSKLDAGEPLSWDDISALHDLISMLGGSDESSDDETADYTNIADALDVDSIVPAEPAPLPDTAEEVGDGPEGPLADWEKELLGYNDPVEDFNAEGALDVDAAKAAWQKSLQDYLDAGGMAYTPGSGTSEIYNPLSDSQKENFEKIIEDLPAALGTKLGELVNRHIAKDANDDELIQGISEVLLDVPFSSKLRGRLRGAQAGVQQNKGVLIPILRPKPEAYKGSGSLVEGDLVLSSPEVVKGTLQAVIKQSRSGNDLAGIKDADEDGTATKEAIAAAGEQLTGALDAFNSGDVEGMVGSMREALDLYDQAIALRKKVHKADTVVRRLRARRRALDEVLAGFEGRWPDPKIMGNPQVSNDYYTYDDYVNQPDRDGNAVYPGDKIKRTNKTALDQTGLVLGWKQLANGKWTAHLWLDAEQKDRPQGVTQTVFVLDAVGPNNPLYHDPSYTGARVDDEMNSFIEKKKSTVQANQNKKQAAKAAKAEAASTEAPTPAAVPEAPAADTYQSYLAEVEAASTEEELLALAQRVLADGPGVLGVKNYNLLMLNIKNKYEGASGGRDLATALDESKAPVYGSTITGEIDAATTVEQLQDLASETNSLFDSGQLPESVYSSLIDKINNKIDEIEGNGGGGTTPPDAPAPSTPGDPSLEAAKKFSSDIANSSTVEEVNAVKDAMEQALENGSLTFPDYTQIFAELEDRLDELSDDPENVKSLRGQINLIITPSGVVVVRDSIEYAYNSGDINEKQREELLRALAVKEAELSPAADDGNFSQTYTSYLNDIATATSEDELDLLSQEAAIDYKNGELSDAESELIGQEIDDKFDELANGPKATNGFSVGETVNFINEEGEVSEGFIDSVDLSDPDKPIFNVIDNEGGDYLQLTPDVLSKLGSDLEQPEPVGHPKGSEKLPEGYTQPPVGSTIHYKGTSQGGKTTYVVEHPDGSLKMYHPQDSLETVPGSGGINDIIHNDPSKFEGLPGYEKYTAPDAGIHPYLPPGYPTQPKGTKVLFQTKSQPHDYVVQHPDGSLHNVSQTPSLDFPFDDDSQDPAGFANNDLYEPANITQPVFHALPHEAQGKSGEMFVMVNGEQKWGRYGAAGIAVTADDNGTKKVLLGMAGDTGVWYLPGGALEELEDPIQGATRELHEEILDGDLISPNLSLVSTHEAVLGKVEVYAQDEVGNMTPGSTLMPTDSDWKYTTYVAELPAIQTVTPPPDAPAWEFVEFDWVDAEQLAAMEAAGSLHPALSGGKLAKMVGFEISDGEPLPIAGDAPSPENISHVQYDISDWKKVTGTASTGTHTGAVYQDTDGNKFFVKSAPSVDHAQNEVVASKFYELLGVNASRARLGTNANGETFVVTPFIEGKTDGMQQAIINFDEEYFDKIRADFAIDAWLGNYDVTSPYNTNIISDTDGNPVRVDQGGALLYRATGAKKHWWSNEPTDIDDMRKGASHSGSYNVAKNLFGKMSDEQVAESAKKLAQISPKDIEGIINASAMSNATKLQLINDLVDRRHKILERFGLLQDPSNKAATTTDAGLSQVADGQAAVKASNPSPGFSVGDELVEKVTNYPVTVTQVMGNGWLVVKYEDGSEKVDASQFFGEKAEVEPTSEIAWTYSNHDFKVGDTVTYWVGPSVGWVTGTVQGTAPGLGGSKRAHIKLDSDGSDKYINFDKVMAATDTKKLAPIESYTKAPEPTTAGFSLGDEYATLPEGSTVHKKNQYGTSVWYAVQHPDGTFHIYQSGNKVLPSFGKSPDSFKAEKGWVNVDTPSAPAAPAASSGPVKITTVEDLFALPNGATAKWPMDGEVWTKIDSNVWQSSVSGETQPVNMFDGSYATVQITLPDAPAPAAPATPKGDPTGEKTQLGEDIHLGDYLEITKYKPKDWVGTMHGTVLKGTNTLGQVLIRVTDAEGTPMFKNGNPWVKLVNPKFTKHANTPDAPTVPGDAATPAAALQQLTVPTTMAEFKDLPINTVVKYADNSSSYQKTGDNEWTYLESGVPSTATINKFKDMDFDAIVNSSGWIYWSNNPDVPSTPEPTAPAVPAAPSAPGAVESSPAAAPAAPGEFYQPAGVPSSIVFSNPDVNSPLYGEDKKPEAPKAPTLTDEGPIVGDDWIAKANEQYKARKLSKYPDQTPGEVQASSIWNRYEQAMSGNVNSLDSLLNDNYITQDMHTEAKTVIEKRSFDHGVKVAEFTKALDEFKPKFDAWKAANGVASVVPVPHSQAMALSQSEAYDYMQKNYKPGTLPNGGSGVGAQKSGGWQEQIRAMSQLLGIDRDEIEKVAGPHNIKIWDMINEEAAAAPTFKDAFRVIMTRRPWQFSDKSGKPFSSGDDLSDMIGTVQKEFGAMEFTPGALEVGGLPGYAGGSYDVLVDLVVPPGVKGVWTGGGQWGFGGKNGEMGIIAEPGLAMYIWGVEKIGTYINTTGGGGHTFKWKVKASLIPKDALPYMDNFEGSPGSHSVMEPANLPSVLPTTYTPNALIEGGIVEDVYDDQGNTIGEDN